MTEAIRLRFVQDGIFMLDMNEANQKNCMSLEIMLRHHRRIREQPLWRELYARRVYSRDGSDHAAARRCGPPLCQRNDSHRQTLQGKGTKRRRYLQLCRSGGAGFRYGPERGEGY